MEDYKIRDCHGADEYPNILGLLEKNFVNGEPSLTMFLDQNKDKITQEDKVLIMEDLMTMYEAFLKNLLCRVVEHQGVIVGVNLMFLEDNPALGSGAKSIADVVGHLRSDLLVEYNDCVILGTKRDVDFFKIYPDVNRALELVVLAVEEKHRGKGLATALIRDSIELAKSKKADMVYGQFTSPYLKKTIEKIGFQTLLNFRDRKGNSFYKDTSSFVISEMFMLLR